MFLTYSNYAREEAERRQVRDAFSRYMSPALVERLAEDPSRLKLGGEMRDMTLLFCDVRGFTTISEQFSSDPEGLTKLINRFLTPMTNVILERKGTIDKYMGDCIMAFWNAPLDDDLHSANACRSALAMIDCMKQVNVELKAEADEKGMRYFPLNVGIGLNSGNVCVGNMGSDQRFDYSVLGDSVNLASRLEGQSKTYGVTIVIGESTRNEAPDYAAIELDLIKVKGKTLPVRIFTLLGDSEVSASAAFQTLAARHQQMLDCYRGQDWASAQQALDDCRVLAQEMGATLDGLYDLYQERLDTYRETPPGADWDGVFTATSK
jgi:adenylate cyclase